MMSYNFGDAALEEMLTRSGCKNIKKFSEKMDKRIGDYIKRKVRIPKLEGEGPEKTRITIIKDWQDRIAEERKGMKHWTDSFNLAVKGYVTASRAIKEKQDKI
jgi:hypothetical protein